MSLEVAADPCACLEVTVQLHRLLISVTAGRTLTASRYGQWRTQEFFSGGGVQQIQLRTEDKEDGDLGAVAP